MSPRSPSKAQSTHGDYYSSSDEELPSVNFTTERRKPVTPKRSRLPIIELPLPTWKSPRHSFEQLISEVGDETSPEANNPSSAIGDDEFWRTVKRDATSFKASLEHTKSGTIRTSDRQVEDEIVPSTEFKEDVEESDVYLMALGSDKMDQLMSWSQQILNPKPFSMLGKETAVADKKDLLLLWLEWQDIVCHNPSIENLLQSLLQAGNQSSILELLEMTVEKMFEQQSSSSSPPRLWIEQIKLSEILRRCGNVSQVGMIIDAIGQCLRHYPTDDYETRLLFIKDAFLTILQIIQDSPLFHHCYGSLKNLLEPIIKWLSSTNQLYLLTRWTLLVHDSLHPKQLIQLIHLVGSSSHRLQHVIARQIIDAILFKSSSWPIIEHMDDNVFIDRYSNLIQDELCGNFTTLKTLFALYRYILLGALRLRATTIDDEHTKAINKLRDGLETLRTKIPTNHITIYIVLRDQLAQLDAYLRLLSCSTTTNSRGSITTALKHHYQRLKRSPVATTVRTPSKHKT